MARKPAQAETAKGKGYKTRGLTATKWKKSAHPPEDAAVLEKKTRGKSRKRTEEESSVRSLESRKLL